MKSPPYWRVRLFDAILLLWLALVLLTPRANAQAVRFDSDATTTSASCASGKQCPVQSLPGTQVNFCSGANAGVVNVSGKNVTWVSGQVFSTSWTGQISINGTSQQIATVASTTVLTTVASLGTLTAVVYSSLSACLASPATTYKFFDAATPCSTTAQLTPQTGGACLATANNQGEFGAWFLPGQYSYYLRVPATAGGGTYGPYPINVGASAGCPQGVTCDQIYTTLPLACTAAGTGTLYLTRTWSGLTTQGLACNIQASANGIIRPASGQTVSLTGSFAGSATQHFDLSSGGLVSLAGAKIPTIYFQWFGATGDGSTDDSTAIQRTITAAGGSGANFQFIFTPLGYRFKNVTTGSHVRIFCSQGTVLKMPNSFNGSTDYMFANDITGAATTDIEIGGNCILDGNRANQSGGAGDGNAIGVLFNGSSNTVIHGLFRNFWTDAVYLGCSGSHDGPGDNITLAVDLHVTANRRNGVSVICATNLKFNGPIFDNNGSTVGGQQGTAPSSGLDIEPDNVANVIQNISGYFTSHDNQSAAGCTPGNCGAGFQYFEQLTSRLNSGVTLDCTCYNNATFGGRIETFSGAIKIGGVTVHGHYYGNGAQGPGWASVLTDENVINSLFSGTFNETNAGTITLSINGTNNSIGSGYYSGATYDFYIDPAATCEASTAAINSHGLSGFNPAGIKCLPGVTGTFTPVLSFGGGATGITYTTRVGTYYRVGHVVTLTVRLVLSSKGSSTGAATITGFPFTMGSYSAGSLGYWAALAGLNSIPTFYGSSGSTGGFLEQLNSNTGVGTGSQGLLDTNLSNTSEIVMTISYGI